MENTDVLGGIIIGAVGGGIAGLVIWLADLIRKGFIKRAETKRIETWLKNSENNWRSTRAIASHNNIPEDRVRYLCSYSKKISLNTKDGNDSKEHWRYD